MDRTQKDWEDLGRSIQEIVDRAVNSSDYQKLNQTIRQTVEKAVDAGGEAVRRAAEKTSRVSYQRSQEVIVEPKNLPALYGSTKGTTLKGIAKIAGGAVLSAFSFLLLVGSGVLMLIDGQLMPVVLSDAGLGGGVSLIVNGVGNLGKVSRFRAYRKTLGQKTFCSLEKLARSVGKTVKFVHRELQSMIRDGLFLEGHMDKEEKHLIISDETFRQFENSRLQLEQRQKQAELQRRQQESSAPDPRVREVLDKGNAFIAEIRRCNDAIPGAEISAKIDRMELLTRRIFQRAKESPEIIPDLKKMMDYYLPMTVKLLNAYVQMDAQPVQGDTIRNSKQEIEQTLDTLNLAFEKLLDELFADTAMDISSDISVLNTLLAQEGLMQDDFSKLKETQNP